MKLQNYNEKSKEWTAYQINIMEDNILKLNKIIGPHQETWVLFTSSVNLNLVSVSRRPNLIIYSNHIHPDYLI